LAVVKRHGAPVRTAGGTVHAHFLNNGDKLTGIRHAGEFENLGIDVIVPSQTTAAGRVLRAATPSAGASRMATQALIRLATAVLVGFHTWLLWTHSVTGKIFEPDVIARWAVAGLVVAAFLALRRLGLPLFWGRRAVVLWLLVILIHCHALWAGETATIPLAVPQAAVELLPAALQAAALALALFAAWLALRASASRPRPRVCDVPCRFAGLPAAVPHLQFSPRPPPVS
jgi:hypothetical protein